MAQDLVDFLKADFSQKKEYVIDQLISSDGYGIFAGRTGLGKTNLLLNISVWLSTGFMFFFHPVKRIKVGFFAFEGSEANLQDRYRKIIQRGGENMDKLERGWCHVERIQPFILDSKSVAKFQTLIEPYDLVMFDPVKWLVGRNYTNPDRAAEFTSVFTSALHQSGKLSIISQQIRKRDNRSKCEPGDLFEMKGAADYVEDATFACLLERTEMRGKHVPAREKDRYVTLYIPKHREAVEDLDPLDLKYNYSNCKIEVMGVAP